MPTASITKVTSPGDIVALIPHLLGFRPERSLVAVSLQGPRSRIGLTTRADLPPDALQDEQVAATVRAMVSGGGAACLLVVFTDADAGSELPWAGLVQALGTGLAAESIDVREALLVRAGRWFSYRCERECCPREGTPCSGDAPTITAIAAEMAAEGRTVLPDRAALVASITPVLPLGPYAAEQQQARALCALGGPQESQSRTRSREVEFWRVALDAWEQRPSTPAPADAARLIVALHLVPVRDEVASWALRRRGPLLGLLLALCRCAVGPDSAPVCAVTAWVAYAGGEGALAVVACERALANDPTCSLARLLLQSVDQHVRPEQVRSALRAATRVSRSGK